MKPFFKWFALMRRIKAANHHFPTRHTHFQRRLPTRKLAEANNTPAAMGGDQETNACNASSSWPEVMSKKPASVIKYAESVQWVSWRHIIPTFRLIICTCNLQLINFHNGHCRIRECSMKNWQHQLSVKQRHCPYPCARLPMGGSPPWTFLSRSLWNLWMYA